MEKSVGLRDLFPSHRAPRVLQPAFFLLVPKHDRGPLGEDCAVYHDKCYVNASRPILPGDTLADCPQAVLSFAVLVPTVPRFARKI